MKGGGLVHDVKGGEGGGLLPPVPLLSALNPTFCLQIIMAEQFIFGEDDFLKTVQRRATPHLEARNTIWNFYKKATQRKKFVRGMMLAKESRYREQKRKEMEAAMLHAREKDAALLLEREEELQATREREEAAAKELGV